ncbi:hypothetical protein B0H11DRAFT_2431997 [Mycena galericulata]|nr:hypothetical protein B0H11DRAFT_2431997 [Mycena galericulata]
MGDAASPLSRSAGMPGVRRRRWQAVGADVHFAGASINASPSQLGHPLPELPPELWILILELSTYPPFSCPSKSTAYDPAPPSLELPTSFLSPPLTPASLAPRLAHYRASMRHKRNLALVSHKWHAYAQPVLYASIWIARSKQAEALALTLLCGAACLPASASSSVYVSASASHPDFRDRSTPADDDAPRPAPPHVRAGVGRFIRRLHVETPALERCNPADLRAIVDYAPALEVYSDYRSVRRCPGAHRAPDAELFRALAQGGGLRRLSWTNYDDPALVGLGLGLGMGVGLGGGAYMGGRLEYLELNFVSSAAAPVTAECDWAAVAAGAAGGLVLPALRTLKVTLDNATFAVLSTWALPALRNLSVLSADFSYASAGFRRFFAVHGGALRQLELGHSSAHIEEHYLTAPPPAAAGGGNAGHGLSLAAWCPNLEEFVCSADAEWNWQHPDWIAPHTLLPTHPTISLIGIRGIDARLRDDFERRAPGEDTFFGLREQVESLLRREAFPRLKYVRDMSEGSDAMRRGAVGLRGTGPAPVPGDVREKERVVRFWEGVLGRCKEEGVWLEDWRGVNVTSGSLRRARMGLRAGA